MNYSRFLTVVSARRKPSAIREITALIARSPPSTISLASGMPNPQLFPFESAEIKLKNGQTLVIDAKRMTTALQYAPTPGLADLLSWLKKLQKNQHNPPTFDKHPEPCGMDMTVTIGAQDGLCKTIEMMVSEGDNVIIDCPTYAGSLGILRPLGCNLLPIETDEAGMKPESLMKALSPWQPSDAKDAASKIPKVLYTVPNGVNPTGASLTLERKKQIYEICTDYDVVILEDDPYFYLQFGKRVPSFLSLDVDGRVMRFDSFSKIMSSGLRIGFATGPHALIEKLQLHMQTSVLHTSAMSQVLVHDVLDQWGIHGFLKHVDDVVQFYSTQKEAMMAAMSKHLTGLAEWTEPKAGMFVWMKLLGIPDTKDLIEQRALEKEVILVPGCFFMPDSTQPCPYVRAAFSLATPEQMDTGMERLASLIKDEIR